MPKSLTAGASARAILPDWPCEAGGREIPYDRNRSRELCERCKWRQFRGIIAECGTCKMFALTTLRAGSPARSRVRPRKIVRLLFAFCSHKKTFFCEVRPDWQ